MYIENICCNKSGKSVSQNLLFEFFVFRFHFVSALQYLHCYDNEYLVKQTALFELNLSLKPAFFLVYFCYFWKVKNLLILNVFISEYLDQSPRWKEIRGAFSVTFQTKNVFSLKIKIKQNPGCPNKEYNEILKHIRQNIRSYTRSKKTLH